MPYRSPDVHISDLNMSGCKSRTVITFTDCQDDSPTSSISHSEISEGNFQDLFGAVLLEDSCKVALDSVAFLNNSGGALSLGRNANVQADNCLFMGNSRNDHGGAVLSVDEVNMTFENCAFKENSARNIGGTIHMTVS